MEVTNLFYPLVKKWFTEKFKTPTEIQEKGWPVIAENKHVLITAPTGNGKTLTAFLWALDNLIRGTWEPGRLSVLYISPLKALNNDIRENLLSPLKELKALFEASGEPFPGIRVLTRSGDTPRNERRRMIKHPPEILITTPESLNLILSSIKVRPILRSIKTVILDEIHALASSKRGSYLITAVDRLVPLAGDFQRIALSATVNPLQVVADFIGGYRLRGGVYEKRKVEIIKADALKKIDLKVRFPEDARETLEDKSWWPALVREMNRVITGNRSTLIFANTRRLTEKIARFINEKAEEKLCYAHHGSLSKEIRNVVEKRLKNGELSAIVATNSLELGIDIGSLDEVLLVQTPFTVSSAFQRIGRAGHSVGEVSRGAIIPTHGRDFLNAAIMAHCIMSRDIDESNPVTAPLDVLAQVILSMTGVEEWDLEELYSFIKTSYPFHRLSEKEFDLVISMLNGRYSGTQIRELNPRLSVDRIDGRVKARKGVLQLLYMSGGTIPDRGYYELRVKSSGARIGELDEEFVWERKVGHTFNLGTQNWKITNIDHKTVEVIPWKGPVGIIPFWNAEKGNSGFHFSEQTGLFLEKWHKQLESPAFKQELQTNYYMDETPADELIGWLKRQQKASGAELPHRHHLLVEHYIDKSFKIPQGMIILHTLWGGKVNYPFALALSAALEETCGYQLEVMSDNTCVLIMLAGDFNISNILNLVNPGNIEKLLAKKLEGTGFFGARFRECAGRAMLLPRFGFNSRLPLWLNRLRSKKLLEAVQNFNDFPIIIETWRTCINDHFDLVNLKKLLDELAGRRIRYTEVKTGYPSPFAEELVFHQVEKYMYERDNPSSGKKTTLDRDIIDRVIFSQGLRPLLETDLINRFNEKIQRLAPGYSPGGPVELVEWVKVRLALPEPEWESLMEAVRRDHEKTLDELLIPVASRIVKLLFPGAATGVVTAVESLPYLTTALGIDTPEYTFIHKEGKKEAEKISVYIAKETLRLQESGHPFRSILFQWLGYYGPVKKDFIVSVFAPAPELLEETLAEAEEDRFILADTFRKETDAGEIILKENLEILLRMKRQSARPPFDALDCGDLPLFIAVIQGLTANHGDRGREEEDLKGILEQLFGYQAPPGLWEKDIFPARLPGYSPGWLDRLMADSTLTWFCGSKQRLGFSFLEDMELFTLPSKRQEELNILFPGTIGKYSFWEIKEYSGMTGEKLTETLWNHAWKGEITCNNYEVLRKGLESGFKSGTPEFHSRGRPGRNSYSRWKAARPTGGLWFPLDRRAPGSDELDDLELSRDRVRQLLVRYGILCREICLHEPPSLKWGVLFKTLRLMELSGEVLSGYFFKGLGGPQFISPEAFQRLEDGLDSDHIFWLNAADPASFCGKSLNGVTEKLPSRLPSNHVVYHGSRPVLISAKNGKELNILIEPGSGKIKDYCVLFQALLNRRYNPLKLVKTEIINNQKTSGSPYKEELLAAGFYEDYNCLVLRKKY